MMMQWKGKVSGFAIAGLGAALVLVNAFSDTASSTSFGVSLAMIPWIGVGAFIVGTRPGNPIGWLFSVVGLLWLAGETVTERAIEVTDAGASMLGFASLFADSYWIPGLGLLFVAVLLFPSGRLPSPGWRPAFVVIMVGLALALGRVALATSVQAGGEGLIVDNPIGLDAVGFVETDDEVPIMLFLFATAITAMLSFVARFRRSKGAERLQLKWMALAVPALVASWVLAGALEEWRPLADLLRAVSIALIPMAAGLAITRFHLYDVDRVISRTTAYALVTGVLLGVYVVVVTSLTSLVPTSESTGEPDSWVVAVATLAAAAVFRPVLTWAQTLVDRRFNREQYDAQLAVESFADRLREEVDPQEVLAGLLSVVDRTVAPAEVGLWVRDGER